MSEWPSEELLKQEEEVEKERVERTNENLKNKLCPKFGTVCKQDLCWAFHKGQAMPWMEELPFRDEKTKKIIDYKNTGRIYMGILADCGENIFPRSIIESKLVGKDIAVPQMVEGEYTGTILRPDGSIFQPGEEMLPSAEEAGL